MAISIKDPETDRLARELAAATGVSLTEAIREALQERLAREAREVARGESLLFVGDDFGQTDVEACPWQQRRGLRGIDRGALRQFAATAFFRVLNSSVIEVCR